MKKTITIVAALGILMFGGVFYGVHHYTFGTVKTVEGTITDKYVKNQDSDSKFYIVLDNKIILENSDSLLRGKYNSADIQATLHKGERIKVKVYGARNNFLSMYQNIYEVE